MEFAKVIRARLTFFEDVLGTSSNNPNLHEEYIASKASDDKEGKSKAEKMAEEIEALGVDEVVDKQMTVFPRNAKGNPIFWDYQFKGFFKDSCKALRKVTDSASSKVKAYKQEIDGLIFVFPRQIEINLNGGEMGECQRPLRASTAQGERIAIAHSETCPAGSSVEIEIKLLTKSHEKVVREWLDYGELKGCGAWRNSSAGRFHWEELDENGNVIGGNKR